VNTEPLASPPTTDPVAAPPSPPPARRRRRWPWLLPLAVLTTLAAAIGIAEWQGWRFLAQPAERWLSDHLDREVSFGADGATGFRLSLLGRIRLQVDELGIANPAWSELGPMVQARQAELKLRYRDLMAARGGHALTVQGLKADSLQLQLERTADGRASWQFGEHPATTPSDKPAIDGVHFESLIVRDGRFKLVDTPSAVTLDGQFAYLPDAWQQQPGWTAQAKGRYRDAPIAVQARTGAVLPGIDALAPAEVPLAFEGSAGRARLKFDGSVRDLLGQQSLSGRYTLSGPSLAAVGEPMGVTLPTTAAFTMQGQLQRDGYRWTTQVQSAHIGRSRLAGDFEFRNKPGELPSLSGELRGPALWLQDLGPAIGVEPKPELAKTPSDKTPPTDAHVLPDRPLDLPSLAVMQADVKIKLDRLELGHPKLQSMRPLKAHLTLNDSVLTLEDLDATLAQGRVWGRIRLDGRQPNNGIWTVDLATSGLRLEQWIEQARSKDQPPYIAGDLGGRFKLTGHGRSVADLLATADGQGQLLWTRGQMSHLVVEAVGIDIAQALGVMVRGDRALAVDCGAADLKVRDGLVTPDVLVVDTKDSTLWATGKLSLASEKMDLTAHAAPKDVSPLALRTPLHVRGTLGDPDVSLEKGPLARRAVPAVLLGMLHPLAALLPLIDTGSDQAEAKLAGCKQLVARQQQAAQKIAGTRTAPAP
jgi:uncharacterized protein involved in outer membrane biogenesis